MSKNLGGMNPPSGTRSYIPEEVSTERGGYPTGDPVPPFRYGHLATRWRVLDGRVVPDLSKISQRAGSQHVQETRGGKINTSRQRTTLEDRGFVLIPYSEGPDGSYLRIFDTRPVGYAAPTVSHCSAWEEPSVGSPDLEVDEVGLADWLEGLVKRGLINPPSAQVLRRKAKTARSRLAVAEGKLAHGSGGLAPIVEDLRREVAAWDKALAGVTRVKAAVVLPDLEEDEETPVEPAPVAPRKKS